MTALIILSTILHGTGLLYFIRKIILGLQSEVTALKTTIDTQTKTIEVMDKRISETEKIGEMYRKLLRDLPEDIENYRNIISKTKDSVIEEQKKAIEQKDERLKKRVETELHEIERIEKIVSDLPKLRDTLETTITELQTRISALSMLDQSAQPSRSAWVTRRNPNSTLHRLNYARILGEHGLAERYLKSFPQKNAPPEL